MSSSYSSLSGTGIHSKFPFLLVPVSPDSEDIDSRKTNTAFIRTPTPVRKQNHDVDNIPRCPVPSSQDLLIPKKPNEFWNNGSSNNSRVNTGNSSNTTKRSTAIKKQLNAHFSPAITYPTLLQTFSAHDQLRRPARLLYPNSSSTITSDRSDDLKPKSIIYNGVHITEENYQELLRPINNIPKAGNLQSQALKSQNKFTTISSEDLSGLMTQKSRHDHEHDSEKRKVVFSQSESGDCSKQNCNNVNTCSPLQLQVDGLVKQLKVRDVEISNLRDELTEVKKSIKGSTNSNNCCQSLRKGLAKVEKQLEYLEVKVEYCEEDIVRKSLTMDDLPQKSYNNLGIELGSPPFSFSPDFDRIIRLTRELNSLVGNASIELCYNSGGATFKQSKAVTLTLYKNGLILDESPTIFRSFANPSTLQFIQDIYDGYFPTELQDKYPEGITLIVEDKRLVIYSKSARCFEGKGETLSTACLKQPVPKFLPGMKCQIVKPSSLDKITPTESLSLSSLSMKSESNYEELPELIPNYLKSFHHKSFGIKIITLKLKSMVTGNLYKFKVSIDATIENLIDYLEENLEDDKQNECGDSELETNRKFELINILPFGSFSKLEFTLKEYGIISNTLLYFRSI